MNLADFIDETLSEVIAGIRSAQAKAEGGNIVAATPQGFPGSALMATGWGVFAVVDFDVSVTAETTAGGKASVKVFGALDFGGSGDHRSTQASRIKFSVPVRLPDGDQTQKERAKARHEENFGRDLSAAAKKDGW